MSGESVGVVHRRGRAEIARVAGLYRASGLGRSAFRRRHGMALSTLNRHLKKQRQQEHRDADGVGRGPLVEVELATAVSPIGTGDQPGSLTVLLSNGRRKKLSCLSCYIIRTTLHRVMHCQVRRVRIERVRIQQL
jgi:hypothetical protein